MILSKLEKQIVAQCQINKNTEWPTPISIKLNEDIFEDKYQKKKQIKTNLWISFWYCKTQKYKLKQVMVIVLIGMQMKKF